MNINRNWITGGLAATALVAVVGGTALAQSTPAPKPTSDVQTDNATGTQTASEDADEQPLNGSITAPEDESLSDEQEAKSLAELPGLISESDAIAAATADGGTAKVAELENEDGSVVYEVDVTADDGTVEEVTVDAGNGDILEREADDHDDDCDEADEGPETNEANEANEAPQNSETTGATNAN